MRPLIILSLLILLGIGCQERKSEMDIAKEISQGANKNVPSITFVDSSDYHGFMAEKSSDSSEVIISAICDGTIVATTTLKYLNEYSID